MKNQNTLMVLTASIGILTVLLSLCWLIFAIFKEKEIIILKPDNIQKFLLELSQEVKPCRVMERDRLFSAKNRIMSLWDGKLPDFGTMSDKDFMSPSQEFQRIMSLIIEYHRTHSEHKAFFDKNYEVYGKDESKYSQDILMADAVVFIMQSKPHARTNFFTRNKIVNSEIALEKINYARKTLEFLHTLDFECHRGKEGFDGCMRFLHKTEKALQDIVVNTCRDLKINISEVPTLNKVMPCNVLRIETLSQADNLSL